MILRKIIVKNLLPLKIKGKKGVAESILVIMIAGLIGLLVLLIVTGTFGKLFKSVLGKNECQMEFLISSFTKAGGLQTTEPSCDPHLVTVTIENLTKNTKKIQDNINAYDLKYRDQASVNEYIKKFKDPASSQKGSMEWAMDEIIAKEMKYCWDIAGRGKLDLFSNWGVIMCTPPGITTPRPCTNEEMKKIYEDHAALAVASGAVGGFIGYKLPLVGGASLGISAGAASAAAGPLIFERIMGNIKGESTPTFCVLCSRIKFDQEVQNQDFFKNKQIDSLDSWMANNPVSDITTDAYSKVPYAVYLQNDAYKGIFTMNNQYKYTTNEAYAVVYTRINTFGIPKYYNQLIKSVSTSSVSPDEVKDIQTIQLMRYQDLKSNCTVLVG